MPVLITPEEVELCALRAAAEHHQDQYAMLTDNQTLAEIQAVILALPQDDRDFVLAELAYLEAKVQADPRQALVIALVGAKMAAHGGD